MRLILSVILIALIAAMVWMFRTPPVVNISAGDSVAAASPTEGGEVDPAAGDPVRPDAPARTDTGGPALDRAAIEATAGASTGGLVAVRFGTEQPIAGAEVGYLPDPDAWELFTAADHAARSRDEMAWFRHRGRVQETDANGRCRLAIPKGGLSVTLRFENLYATARLRAGQTEPLVVELRPDQTLRLLVLDFAGKPAGGVKISTSERSASVTSMKMRYGATNEAGRFELAHAQIYTDADGSRVVNLIAEGFGVQAPLTEIDLAEVPRDEIILRLPHAGTISAELVTAAGAPFDLTGFKLPQVLLQMSETPPKRGGGGYSYSPSEALRFDRQGRHVLRNVAFGQFYTLRVSSLLENPLHGSGPTQAEPDLILKIVVPEDLVILTGRIIDAAEAPFATERVDVTCRYSRGMSSQSTPTEDGLFTLSFPHLEPGQVVDVSAEIPVPGEPSLTSIAAKGLKLKKGRNALGDVRLRPAPLLLSGRVITPKESADAIRVRWKVERMDTRWRSDYAVKTRWLDATRFELRGEVAEGTKLRLRFRDGKHLPLEPLEFTPGTEDVEIKLALAGSAKANLLVDDVACASVLVVTMKLATAAVGKPPGFAEKMQQRMANRFRLRSAGKGQLTAAWDGLTPGAYEFRVEVRGAAEPLVAIAGIKVAGGAVVDERLVDIDLRGRLRAIEITVLDHEGKAVTDKDALVVVVDPARGEWCGHALQNGKSKLNVTANTSIRVLVPGYQLAVVDDVRESHTVRLERATAVKFRVEWPFPLPKGITPQLQVTPQAIPGATRRTRLSYSGGGTTLSNRSHCDGFIDAEGRATVQLQVLGQQSFRIALDPQGRGHYLHSIEPRTLEITGNETAEIVLVVNASRLQKTLDRMRK